MKSLIYVFLGGGVGSVFRFLLSNHIQKIFLFRNFPAGTFVVNALGCLIIGILSAYFIKNDNNLKFLIITGFCGGFTTFSTFSAENYSLLQGGHYVLLVMNILLSIIIGILAVYVGIRMAS